jgi:hypothetical protein
MPETSQEMTNILQQMFSNQTDIAAAVELVTYEVGNTLTPLRDSSIMSELFLEEISKLMGIMVKGIDTLAKNKGGAPGGGNSSQSIIPSASDIVKSITFGVFPKVVKAYAKGMRNLITELSDINDVSLEKLKTFSEASKAISEFAKIRVSGVIKAGVASRLLGGSIKSFVETLSKLSDASVKKLSALAEAFSDFNKVEAGPMLKFGLALIFIRKPLTDFIDAINNTTVGNFVKSADNISKGVTKLGKADVSSLTKLGNTILKVGGGFILFAGGLFVLGKSLKTFSEVKWEDLGKAGLVIGGIVAATYGLSKIQGSLLKSALGIAAMGAALAVTAIALRTFESVKWEDLGKATVALGGLALLGTFLGKSMATIAKGALAIGLLGASLIPLAFGLNLLKDVSWKSLGIAAVALVGLTLAAAGLGALLMGPQAALFAAGVLAIAALGAALIPLAYGLNVLSKVDMKAFEGLTGVAASLAKASLLLLLAAPGMTLAGAAMLPLSAGLTLLKLAIGDDNKIGEFFDSFSERISKLDGGMLFGIAGGIAAIGAAIAGFGVGEAAAGLGNFIGKLLSFGADSPLEKLMKLSKEGYNLIGIGQSIKAMGEGMKYISDLNTDWASFGSFPWDKIEELKDFKTPIQIIASNSPAAAASNGLSTVTPSPADTVSAINSPGNSGGGMMVVNNVSRGGDVHNVSNSNVNQNLNGAAGPILTGSAMGLYAY